MLSNAAAAACAGDGSHQGLLALLAGGSLIVYPASRPANPDGEAGVTALATYTLPSPAASESNGVLTLGTVAAASITASGTAVWFRVTTSGGAALWDGDILTSAGDGLVLSATALTSGGTLSALTGGTLTIPAH
jgi:hypothetical protein